MRQFIILFALLVAAIGAQAQCAMCTKTAADLGDHSAEALNNGIIYLAFIPVMLMLGIAFVWYRYNKGRL